MPDKEEKKEPTKEKKVLKLTEELEKLKEVEKTDDNIDTPPKITFEQFNEFFTANDDLDNDEIYKAFPTVNHGTLRGWKSKAKILGEKTPEGEEEEEEVAGEEVKEEAEGVKKLIEAEVVKQLKIKRKKPSRGTQQNDMLSELSIKKNWYEEMV